MLRQAVVWTLLQWRVAEAKDVLRCLVPDLESHPSTDHRSLAIFPSILVTIDKRERGCLHLAADMPRSCLLSYLGCLAPRAIGNRSRSRSRPFTKFLLTTRIRIESSLTSPFPANHLNHPNPEASFVYHHAATTRLYNLVQPHLTKFETLFPCILYAVTTDPNPSDFAYCVFSLIHFPPPHFLSRSG